MKVIGLTGPMGAGKDEVVKILRRHMALVIDADEVAHTLYVPQSPVWQELVKTFGSKILMRGGKVNRHKLAEIVFSDKRKLRELNRLVHPYLKQAIIEKIERCKSLVVSCKLIMINAAVLKEIGLLDYVDEVWVVMASKANRLKRLMRSGLKEEEAKKRINSQISQKEYMGIADVVIKNDGTRAQLNAKVQAGIKL